MTERVATPLHSRARMCLPLPSHSTYVPFAPVTSELLFELYSIPEVTYCIDGIMSFYKDNGSAMPFTADGLVVSFNTASTSVIPILNGKGILNHAKRFHSFASTVVCLPSSSCLGFHGEHLRPLNTSSNLFN